eukprot:COSAG02_NODE_24398_length_689_cov_1.477966_2_plen_47_part_01
MGIQTIAWWPREHKKIPIWRPTVARQLLRSGRLDLVERKDIAGLDVV